MSVYVSNIKSMFIVLLAIIVCFPIIAITISSTVSSGEYWVINNSVFPEYIINTLKLMLGVGSISFIIGLTTAWFTTFYRIPYRKTLERLLLFPLACPAYIIAHVYTNLLDFPGPVQTMIRNTFNWSRDDYSFFEIRSLSGAIIIMSLSLYPYVYMLIKARLSTMTDVVSISRTLSLPPHRIFYEIITPMLRPAIFASLSLVIMEVIAEFGTMEILSIDTMSTGIYRSWFLLNDYPTATKLACTTGFFAFFLIIFEKFARGKTAYTEVNSHIYQVTFSASRTQTLLITILCMLPVMLGAIIPITFLLYWASSLIQEGTPINIIGYVANSVILATLSGFITVIVAIMFCYLTRFRSKITKCMVKLLSMGYAIPGVVVSIGVLLTLGWINEGISAFCERFFDISINLMLIGTLSGLMYAYIFRFLAISMTSIESGMSKINQELEWSMRLIVEGNFKKIFGIYVPIINRHILTAFLLVFVDTIKELPATLIIRPMNFDTIAIKTYEMISDEMFKEASLFSIIIIAINIAAMTIIVRTLGINTTTNKD